MSWAVISVLLGLIFIGVPIGFALMMTATGMMYAADINLMMIPVQMFSGTNAFPLLAIPLFILMGELMSAHLKSLADYPPVQGGKSFDMSNVVEEFVSKGMQ